MSIELIYFLYKIGTFSTILALVFGIFFFLLTFFMLGHKFENKSVKGVIGYEIIFAILFFTFSGIACMTPDKMEYHYFMGKNEINKVENEIKTTAK